MNKEGTCILAMKYVRNGEDPPGGENSLGGQPGEQKQKNEDLPLQTLDDKSRVFLRPQSKRKESRRNHALCYPLRNKTREGSVDFAGVVRINSGERYWVLIREKEDCYEVELQLKEGRL